MSFKICSLKYSPSIQERDNIEGIGGGEKQSILLLP